MIIKNGTIVSEEVFEGDIRVEGEKIAQIDKFITPREGEEIIDAKGAYVFPGFIDAHTHLDLRNAISRTADNYPQGTKAAILGGTTGIINFCTGYPDKSLNYSLEEELKRAEGSNCHYKFHMEIVKPDEDKFKEFETLKEKGVDSLKIYMAYGFRLTDTEIYETLKKAKECNLLVESHCETGDILDEIMKDLVKEGKNLPQYHEKAHPAEAEAESISRLCYFSKLVDHPVHIVHLSSKLGLEEVRKARAMGVEVTAETCPQYLVLDNSVYDLPGREAATYVFAPPARSKEDQEAILEAVINKEIQTMATDHCAFSKETKFQAENNDLRKIAGGIPGVEHRVPICYTELLASGKISEVDFVKLLAENPAKLYELYPKKGVLKVGSDADIVIYEKDGEYTISKDTQAQHVDYTPYEGYKVKGRVKHVILNGELAVKDGVLIKEGLGRFMP